MGPSDYTNERARRFGLLASLKAIDPTLKAIPASVVRDLAVYGRYRGSYTELSVSDNGSDSTRTAVSMLHTGRHYADDLSADSLIYHYPNTGQPGLDRSDIDAGKAALLLKLPVFVVLYPTVGNSDREIRIGHVVDADDVNKQFLVQFGERPIATTAEPDDAAFAATVDSLRKKRRTANVRANDHARFAYNVSKRYGKKCAVCDIRVPTHLDAAHIVPVSRHGSDDARNGFPLCKNHHQALDAGLFYFESETCEIVAESSYTLLQLGISEIRAKSESGALPHPAAISLCSDVRKAKAKAAE